MVVVLVMVVHGPQLEKVERPSSHSVTVADDGPARDLSRTAWQSAEYRCQPQRRAANGAHDQVQAGGPWV